MQRESRLQIRLLLVETLLAAVEFVLRSMVFGNPLTLPFALAPTTHTHVHTRNHPITQRERIMIFTRSLSKHFLFFTKKDPPPQSW